MPIRGGKPSAEALAETSPKRRPPAGAFTGVVGAKIKSEGVRHIAAPLLHVLRTRLSPDIRAEQHGIERVGEVGQPPLLGEVVGIE